MEFNTEVVINPTKTDLEGMNIFQIRDNYFNSITNDRIVLYIITWNNVAKTKNCIESLIKYTSHIDFEFVVFDNNSQDDTIEYLKNVNFKKTIIKCEENMGVGFATDYILKNFPAKYYASVTNDSVLTENWLDNMLKCIKSDESIGIVAPMQSNLSNMQDPGLKFNNLEQMQNLAKKFNVSNHLLWEERKRLFGTVLLVRANLYSVVGVFDAAFLHNFGDDDSSLRISRSGYKQVLCGDVFVHHDHVQNERGSDEYAKALEVGKHTFIQKYRGFQPWADISNYEPILLSLANYKKDDNNILGVDVRGGTPLYGIKNNFRKNGNLNTSLYSFTTNAKYYNDLLYVCEEENGVVCDRIDFIAEHYFQECADVILLGEYINSYPKPMKLLETFLSFLKPSGQLLFKLKNVSDLSLFAGMLGQDLKFNDDDTNYVNISNKTLTTCFESFGCSTKIQRIGENIPQNIKQQIEQSFKKNPIVKCKSFDHLYTKEFLFCVTKN